MKKKSWIIILLVLAAALFMTNPESEKYYKTVLQEEAGLEDEFLKGVKHSLVEMKYDYKSYYLFGTLRHASGELEYVGFLNQVVRL
jgi:hypothetical protein